MEAQRRIHKSDSLIHSSPKRVHPPLEGGTAHFHPCLSTCLIARWKSASVWRHERRVETECLRRGAPIVRQTMMEKRTPCDGRVAHAQIATPLRRPTACGECGPIRRPMRRPRAPHTRCVAVSNSWCTSDTPQPSRSPSDCAQHVDTLDPADEGVLVPAQPPAPSAGALPDDPFGEATTQITRQPARSLLGGCGCASSASPRPPVCCGLVTSGSCD